MIRVSNEDIVMYTLNGLGREYNQFVITSQHHETPYNFSELRSRFIHHEQWLKNQDQDSTNALDSTNAPSAFYSSSGRGNNSGRGHNSVRSNNFGRGNHSGRSNTSNNSGRGYNNSGRSNNSYNSGRGYNNAGRSNAGRSNFFFGSGSSSNSPGSSSSGDSQHYDNSIPTDFSEIECQICRQAGHTAKRCHFRYYDNTPTQYPKNNN